MKYDYNIGDRCGSRVVINIDDYPLITVKCDCGSEKIIPAYRFQQTKQCQYCVKKDVKKLKKCEVGHKINKMTILAIDGYKYYSDTKYYRKSIKVQCDCGNIQDILLGQILLTDICIKCKDLDYLPKEK